MGLRETEIRRWLPSSTVIYDPPIAHTLRRLAPSARIADIGAGGRRITSDTFTIDGVAFRDVDLVCDIHAIPLDDGTFDCAFCTGTLQYAQDPMKVLAAIHHLSRPGGIVHIEVPFLQVYAPDPGDDFWRWTLSGIRLLCQRAGFVALDSGVHIGPTSVLVSVAGRYLDGLLPPPLGSVSAYGARVLLRPLLVLDRLWRHCPTATQTASGVYFVGRRP